LKLNSLILHIILNIPLKHSQKKTECSFQYTLKNPFPKNLKAVPVLILSLYLQPISRNHNGIVSAHISQYTHLGDGVTKTDNLIYDPTLNSLETSWMGFTLRNYYLHKAFPDIIEPEWVYRGLNYLYGCHPGSNISFVSGVGAHSKEVAYGMNRADFSYIAGGVVPGELILPPYFPENKEDRPYLWGENEYVVNMGASYIMLVHAVNDLLEE